MIGLLKDMDRWFNPHAFTLEKMEELSASRMAKKMEVEKQKQIKYIQESVLFGHIMASSLQECVRNDSINNSQ